MGVLSYTLYLVHYPILNLAEKWTDNRLLVGVSALAASMVIAYAVHLLVEKPMANLRRRFGSRTAEVIEGPRDVDLATADRSAGIAARPLDDSRRAKPMVGYSEWKQEFETEKGS